MGQIVDRNSGYFVTCMPASRPADYYLGYDGGSVFMDFNNNNDGCIYLVRMSFDGYGCCNLKEGVIPMDADSSALFKSFINEPNIDQVKLNDIIRATIRNNRDLLWEDALKEYNLI